MPQNTKLLSTSSRRQHCLVCCSCKALLMVQATHHSGSSSPWCSGSPTLSLANRLGCLLHCACSTPEMRAIPQPAMRGCFLLAANVLTQPTVLIVWNAGLAGVSEWGPTAGI